MSALSEAEEDGYQGTYFAPETATDGFDSEGFIPSSSPDDRRTTPETHQPEERKRPGGKTFSYDKVAEVVFFTYGVVVFYGLEENQEREIIEDIDHAEILNRRIAEDDWEVEECHYTVSSASRVI